MLWYKWICIGILDKETETIIDSYKKPIYRLFDNLVITDNSLSKLESIDDIALYLIESYQALIDDGNYSINEGVWSNYDELDTQKLLELLDS